MSISKERLIFWGSVILVTLVTAGLSWWSYTVETDEAESVQPPSALPALEGSADYQVETAVTLRGKDGSRTIRQLFHVQVADSDSFRVVRKRRRARQGDSETVEATPLSVVIDGNRYKVIRDGVLLLGGESDSGPRENIDGLPGGSTYLVSQLVGRNPFLESPTSTRTSDGLKQSNDTQTVILEGGRVKRASGPPKWTYYQYDPYYEVDYSETVTRRPATATEDPIAISDRVLKIARAETGVRLPNHRFRSVEGEVKRLYDFEGPKLINQWATWCPPCITEIPHLNDIHNRYGDRVTLLGVSNEASQTIRQFLDDHAVDYQVLLRGSPTPIPYRQFRSLPFSFLLDSENRLQAVIRGPRASQQWERLLNEHLLAPDG